MPLVSDAEAQQNYIAYKAYKKYKRKYKLAETGRSILRGGDVPIGSITLSDGTTVEPNDEFRQWQSEHIVKIGEHVAHPDQQLLIWYASKGNGLIHPTSGPMPPGMKLRLETQTDSNGRGWVAIINGSGTFDAHTSSIPHWNLTYKGHYGEERYISIEKVPSVL